MGLGKFGSGWLYFDGGCGSLKVVSVRYRETPTQQFVFFDKRWRKVYYKIKGDYVMYKGKRVLFSPRVV